MRRWVMLAVAVIPLAAEVDRQKVSQIVEKMEALQRVSISPDIDFKLYDPFRRVAPLIEKAQPVKKTKLPRPVPKLTAVMNDRALIDGRWVRVGDRVGGYRLVALSSAGVWIAKGDKRRFLPLLKRHGLLKIKDGEP